MERTLQERNPSVTMIGKDNQPPITFSSSVICVVHTIVNNDGIVNVCVCV